MLQRPEPLLRVEVAVDGALGTAAWAFLRSTRHRLRDGPPELRDVSLRLDWPTRQHSFAVLYVGAEAAHRGAAEAVVRDAASAAGCSGRLRISEAAAPADLRLPQVEHYAGLRACFDDCLACATDVHLAGGGVDFVGSSPAFGYRERQHLALALVVLALDALSTRDNGWVGYPAYHRDWLIRYPILQQGNGFGSASALRELLDEQLIRMGPTDPAAVRGLSATVLSPTLAVAWVNRVRALGTRLAGLAGDAGLRVDVFARDARFPVAFRLFHSVARQFGVALLDEALLHHLLASAAGDAGAEPTFRVAPHLDEQPGDRRGAAIRSGVAADEGLPWKELVALSGEDGRQWIAAYQRSETTIGEDLSEALALLRLGKLEAGCARLECVRAYRDTLSDDERGIYHVLGRFLHGEAAYYHYRARRYERARSEMDAAAVSIRDAIEIHRFLIPIAPMVLDVPLQRARIARAELRWDEVARELGVMREMQLGRRPLVTLRGGTEVTFASVGELGASTQLPPRVRARVLELLDVDARIRDFRRHSSKLYVVPGLVRLEALLRPEEPLDAPVPAGT